jgi:signal transduction histidine kinase/CheY-like chemotaxis protein
VDELNRHFEAIVAEFLRTRKLRSSQDSALREFLGQYPSGWAWEVDSEGKFLWCSSELQNLLGYPPETLVGEQFTSLALSDEAAIDLQSALSSRQPIFNLKVPSKTQDGKAVTLLLNAIQRKSASAGQQGYRGVAQVIEHKERIPLSETAIPEAAVDERKILPAPLADWEAPIGYALVNDEFHPIGAPDSSQIQKQPQIRNGTLRVPILGQQDTLLGMMEFERESDQPEWTEDDAELANTISEQLAHAIQDIRSYQLTQQALDEMRKADQLKTEFLANMTHELRTPLNSIIGFSRVILKGVDGPITEIQKQDLTSIYNAGQHLLGLINNILDFSKIETGKMDLDFDEVDLSEIIHSVMDTATGLVRGRPVEVHSQVPESLPQVWGNSMRIRQVLLNLLSNAIKFTDEGQIGVAVKQNPDNRMELLISVYDSGPGIAPEDIDKLFEPFSQLEVSPTKIYGGTGLGLSICRHLVELHGGRIWVESALGKGSTFHFTLPVTPGEAALREPIEAPVILAVYSDQRQMDYQKRRIESAGYRFHPLAEVGQILTVTRELQPDMILLDPMLPEGSGWKHLLDIRRNPDLRTIPIKTFSLLEDLKSGFDLGIGEIAIKPLLKEVLESAASILLEDLKEDQVIIVIDEDEANLEWTRRLIQATLPGEVRTASSGFEGVVATRQQVPDLVILNLFLSNAGGFRMVESLRIDARTRNTPVILLFPQELSDIQIRQLQLWTNHCRERATFPVEDFYEKLFTQLSRSTS